MRPRLERRLSQRQAAAQLGVGSATCDAWCGRIRRRARRGWSRGIAATRVLLILALLHMADLSVPMLIFHLFVFEPRSKDGDGGS